MGFLRGLMNFFWIILIGIESAITYFFAGILSFVLIIPIFFGVPKAYFNGIPLVFAPYGKDVKLNFGAAPFRNMVWLLFGGLEVAAAGYLAGAVLCLTIVFIPLGLQQFKIAKYNLGPIGAEIVKLK